MVIIWKLFAAVLLVWIIEAKPLDTEHADKSTSVNEMLSEEKTNKPTTLMEEMPNVYLLVSDQSSDAKVNSPIQKRSAEEDDDLETAAGTNVLRPLFVYRQQLAYRERVKKGVIRRPGIRPRF